MARFVALTGIECGQCGAWWADSSVGLLCQPSADVVVVLAHSRRSRIPGQWRLAERNGVAGLSWGARADGHGGLEAEALGQIKSVGDGADPSSGHAHRGEP